jgi:hypothetical protein
MRRILLYLNFVTPKKSDQYLMPETMVDSELLRLTKHVPRTAAEREFHRWLLGWKKRLEDGNAQ